MAVKFTWGHREEGALVPDLSLTSHTTGQVSRKPGIHAGYR